MFNCKSESDGASSTRKVDDPLFGLPDLAILETLARRKERNWGDEQPNNANIVVDGEGGSIFIANRHREQALRTGIANRFM